jgi:predicted transcriptional regulator
VAGTETGSARDIWKRYGAEAQVTKREFDTYFSGASRAVAIRVGAVRSLETPITLAELRRRWPNFAAPQSFRYMEPLEISHLLNGERRALLD